MQETQPSRIYQHFVLVFLNFWCFEATFTELYNQALKKTSNCSIFMGFGTFLAKKITTNEAFSRCFISQLRLRWFLISYHQENFSLQNFLKSSLVFGIFSLNFLISEFL